MLTFAPSKKKRKKVHSETFFALYRIFTQQLLICISFSGRRQVKFHKRKFQSRSKTNGKCALRFYRTSVQFLHKYKYKTKKTFSTGKHFRVKQCYMTKNLTKNFTTFKKCKSKIDCRLIYEMLYIETKSPCIVRLNSSESLNHF